MTTTYDPAVLQRAADDLYSRAALVEASTMILWGLAGLAATALYARAGAHLPSTPDEWLWIAGVGSAVAGYLRGRTLAFRLRLDAQRTLCQLQIERNTRQKEPHPG
jgi:hypothetical protein